MDTKLKNLKYLAFALLVLVTLNSCDKENEITPPPTGGDAPEFTLKNVDGDEVKLSDHDNKVVVLFFFGNSCPSCMAAAPDVESKINRVFGSNSDFQLLGIDQWNGNASSVQAFQRSTGVTFPLLLNGANVAKNYSTTYDKLVVIDKDGKIVFSGYRPAASDINAVILEVEKLLDEEPDNNPPTGDAPAFTLTSVDGKSVSLSDYNNKVVVLFFFGNSCPACISAAPTVKSELITPFESNSEYAILGLDQWDGNQSSVESFKSSTGLTISLLLKASQVAKDYSTTYDRIVIIDKDGNIAFKGTQGAAQDAATAKQKVEMLLAK